jgi:hypothetical protein
MFSAWGKIKAALAIAGAVIVAIGIAFLRGRKAGIDHIEAEQDRRRLESMKQRKEVDDEIDALGAQDVDERLKRWNRVED